ncbi:sacsin [Asparagus officinalis]|uniref:sacsin n=1 Tax=Asparagus officinalis TaxID=4686 RepID=UPI00098E19B8|nr:sacsin [Asparagus officinalis]
MEPSLLEDFGQRVDLTRRIREVLINYPEGTTVLKELIQNADDAGATKVCLCLSHGTESLLSAELAQWQGPALLAYNDAVFTEDDFVSISRIGDSRKHAQAWKTGRFGVGFNSVYHLTDLPSFVSNKYVVLFDPQGAYLPNVSAANPGKRIEYVSSSAISLYKDQFMPYCAFGCDMSKPFHGTLFRFPLRSADQAAGSKLSRQAYSTDDISYMFSQLYKEAIFSLLFLKSIISVEMYIWDTGAAEPQKIYSCSVTSADENTAWHRQALVRLSTSVASSNAQMDFFSLDFLSEATSATVLEKRVDKFFIVQGMASASSKLGMFATMAAKDYDLHLLPWASVAAHISDSSSEDTLLKEGLAFCFLPLPVRTGLTVQVNGYFEVSSNRRNIWFGVDMDRGGKLRSDWNRLLLEYGVAPAFSELLLAARKLLGPTDLYYSLWPSGAFEEPWNILVDCIFKIIYLNPVLYSNSGGGNWISPAEAYIHDMKFSKSNDLSEALVLLGMPIVHLPKVLIDMFFKYFTNFSQRMVSPEAVRNFIRRCRTLDILSSSYKFVLLEYCLSDLIDSDVSKHSKGLPLLPLANGKFGNFSEASQGICYFICDELEYKILSVVPDRVIDRNIPLHLFSRLSQIASSSNANLAFLDGQSFLQFFPCFFPADWKFKNRVSWDPELGTTCHMAAWFVLFWQYLQDRSYDLSIFSEWPILPSSSGHLYRASKFSKLLDAENLSNTMKEILVKIGCKILDSNFVVRHSDLSLYVYNGDAAGILNSIFESICSNYNQLQILFQDLSVDEKTELYHFFLEPKWYYGCSLSDLHIKNCRKLPIFRVYAGEVTNNPQFSNLESPEKYLPPADIPEYFLGGEFVLCTSLSVEEILLRYYKVERMQKPKFYRQHVLNKLGELRPDMRDVIMLSILKELPQLCVDDPSFKESVRTLKFVPTINDGLKTAQSLYDPRVEELYALLEDSDSFPCGLFQDPGILDMLLCLGLRTSVSVDTIMQSARQVESLMYKDQSKANLRGKVLLSYLEVNAVKWLYNASPDSRTKVRTMFSKVATAIKPRDVPSEVDLEKFWTDLRAICWCPVLTTSPHSALPWPSVRSMVAPPKLVRVKSDMWLVSASTRILDGECSSSALSLGLGWSLPPGGSVIAAQLLELGKNNELVTDQMLRQELALAMPKIYSLLAKLIGSDEMDIVKAVLEGCRWIWVGDGFATATEVVLSGHLHLAPYIRVIPVDLAVFKELFLELGVKEYLNPIDYADILCRMATRKGCTPLDGPELRAAILVVQHLAEVQFLDLRVQIYLPDTSSRLFLSTDLVFNDAPWLLDLGEGIFGNTSNVTLNSKRNVHNFVHGNISNDVAEKLGVRSLRRLLLAESSDSMNLSLSGVAEAFGQHEALTTRLKHIVEMYADGPGILFELVQNAEDARASEVVFLLDKTQYGTSSILSPEMAEWQGPALYCFNNSVFSPQDLYAISRIGQDSKLEKPFAIGRFGLGFNCVYHFTDIPGFVSGDNIVLFDPHACHLPGISPTHPGLRIKFVGRRILDQFPDQFSPFLHFGCDLQQSFPGTLFRFPLRNEMAASRSQIKREKYSPEDVELLFSSFSTVVSETLLFLRNVKKISVFVKEGPGNDMQLIHRVSKQNISGLAKEPHPLHAMLNFVNGIQQNGMDKNQFLSRLDKTMDRDLPWCCQKVAVMEESPSNRIAHHWMISECIGGGNAKNKSVSLGNRSHNFIPWASVAAYLHSVNVNDADDSENSEGALQSCENSMQDRKHVDGRAFCFLPLPIITSLPVHINAYFELSSNRRDIWFGNDMAGGGKTRSEWNICLLEDVVAPAYSRLLGCIAEEIGPSDLFFSFWPTSSGLEPWASMVHKFYLSTADLGLPVLYTKARGGQWISTRQAIFPDFTFPKAVELAEALSDAGLPMATVSEPIVDRFMEACPSLHYLNPCLLRTLLIRRKRGFKDKEAMLIALEYCLTDMKGSSFSDNLVGLPLVPLATSSFTMFSKRGEGERIFITSPIEYDLLKNSVPHLLVDRAIPSGVFKKLQDIAQSGLTNMYELTCHSLVELFPRILPAEWEHAKQVSWDPGQQGQPTLEWIGMLWSYLRSSCTDLKIFSKWPILPVGSGHLFQLSESSYVIRDKEWSENMSSLLQKLGCVFLRSDLPLDHPQLKYFVQDATASGIINAVQAVGSNLLDFKELFLNASRGEMHELRSFIFQSKWFSADQMNSKHIETIKHLPIFEAYRSRKLTCLTNPSKWLKPDGIHDDLLDDNFIQTDSDREKSILRCYVGIKEASRAEFYTEHVLNHMSRFLSEPGILSAILHDVKLLMEQDTAIRTAISEIPFVLAANGSWQHPSRLYDPHAPGLQNLLHKEVFFPCDKFLDAGILELLASMGLKRALSFTCLLDSARSVSMLHDSGNVDALTRSQRLLVYLNALGSKLSDANVEPSNQDTASLMLNKTAGSLDEETQDEMQKDGYDICDQDVQFFLSNFISDLSEEEFWSEIRTIAWCPVSISPPFRELPWFASDKHVAPPNITRPRSQMWMVSSKMRILDSDYCSNYIQHKLGWLDSLDVEVLTTQLVEISKSYNDLKLQHEEESFIDAILEREIPSIYSKLQGFVDTDDFKILKEALGGVSWVWIGDNFILPQALAFDSPVKYPPYLYAVPSELSDFRDLLSKLGVKSTFDAIDYVRVLQCLQHDQKEEPLSDEQLSFVHRVLEAFADCSAEHPLDDSLMNSLLIPDSSGVLMHPSNLVYNDAPWLEKNGSNAKHFVHPCITNHLAQKLGIQSLRCSSLVEEEMTRNLPCMDYARICDLLALYGDVNSMLFDLLEMADCCKAKKLHLIYDKREHSRQSLLQHNLGDFQGPSLTVVLEGATLSVEDVCGLQLPPPWKIQGNALNYGLGLISSYFICDLLTIISSGYFFIFDPLGLALATTSNTGPAAKRFSLIGTGLMERFHDQFNPMRIRQGLSSSTSDSTVIRMPLSSKYLKELENGSKRVKLIFDHFISHASSSLLFLKSVLQVSLSTWEEGNLQPSLEYSVSIDPSSSIKRNPFSEKKWRKFQLSRLFSSSSAAIKMHIIAVCVIHGDRNFIDEWLVVLCLGSGQTRNMALDRRYLPYNLTPVAGIAAHISHNGRPKTAPSSSCVLSPLPLSGAISIPVTALGYFLVCHKGGRYLFNRPDEMSLQDLQYDAKSQLTEAWNKELLLCVRDSYVEMVLEFQKLRKDPLTSSIETGAARAISYTLQAYGDKIYYFWPRSRQRPATSYEIDAVGQSSSLTKATEADWESLIEQVIRPFYVRLVDLPVWQLYNGNAVKADEGMFLSQPGSENGENLPPSTVCNFIKEHYPVFSVPWELVKELQAIGVKVREIKPKMVRNLLRSSKSVHLRSIEAYVDVLDYCLSDIQLQRSSELVGSGASAVNNSSDDVVGMPVETLHMPMNAAPSSNSDMQRSHYGISQSSSTSGGDALEMVTYFGKALYDFGRGVVEDIGRAGPLSDTSITDRSLPSIAAELKGMPFPTAANSLARLGTIELWVGNKEQQLLMRPLAAHFIHPQCLEKSLLAEFLSDQTINRFLKMKSFSPLLLSGHMKYLFDEQWVNRVVASNNAPWVSWDNNTTSSSGSPTPEWIRLFWKVFWDLKADLSFVSDWPLIPAFLNHPVLCRVKENRLVFVPPIAELPLIPTVPNSSSEDAEVLWTSGNNVAEFEMLEPTGNEVVESELNKSYLNAFELMKTRYPWLLGLLNQLNIPVYDMSFIDCGASYFFPAPGQSLGQVIVSRLLASKLAGHFSEPTHLLNEDRDRLFTLFASDFIPSEGCVYKREELDMLRELPIYKTVKDTYTRLLGFDKCIVSPTAFFHPRDERCLAYSMDASMFLHALGVSELSDQEVLVKFALPGFDQKPSREQEDILLYVYQNWKDLQLDSATVDALKETNFLRNANELCLELFKPRDLLDPSDPLLTSIFLGEQNRFPGERFTADGWLHILRKVGLRTSSEGDMIVECAQKIELLGKKAMTDTADPDDFEAEFSGNRNEVSFELWSLAGSVVDSIFSNFATLYDHSFCEKIGKIAFVPSEKGLPSIGGKKGGKRVLSSYMEAILLKDWPLAWSSAPILTKQNVIPPEYSWSAFHFRSPPAFSVVLKHLQIVGRNNGEDTLAHWPMTSGMMTVEDASFEILKYLDKIWGTLSSSDIVELQKAAFIPVANGTRLVTVKSLFVRLTINLSPFSFELPSLYLPFVNILKEMGIQEVLSITYARDLLLNIQKSCGYQRLNPNELRAVMEILNFICDGEMQARSDRSEWICDAIVPDDGCRLVLARSCVYVDPYGSQFLGNIDTSRLRFSHPMLPENICITLGIKKLSDIVTEELDDELQLQVMDQIGSIPVNNITEKLLSKSLQDAVWILINSLTNHFPSFKGMASSQIQNLLGHIAKTLQFVQCLYTRFILLPKYQDVTRTTKGSVIPEWEGSRKHRTVHFIDKSKSRILVADLPSYMSIYDVIAVVVSQVLEAPATLPIGPLFACPNGSEKAILNALKLGSERGVSKHEGRNQTLVGKELFPQDALLVQFLPMRPFYTGEIVAWKTGRDGEKLRYGRVPEDVRPTAGQALYRFPVEIAHAETHVLLSTQVFSFRSVSMEDEASTSFTQVENEAIIDNTMSHIQETEDGVNRKQAHQVANELQYGRVSSTELVQAVHDMLSAAGINMDVEKQTLIRTTLTLQEQVKESQVALLVEQEKADAAIKEADAAKSAWSCRICLSAEVNTTIAPCGHVLCHRCSSAVTRCPFCRCQVSKTIKIYRP